MFQLENYYITGLPVDLETLGILYQPTIRELFENKIQPMDILNPFVILEKIYRESDVYCKFQLIPQLQMLSSVGSSIGDENMISIGSIYISIVKSLSILYKTDDITWIADNNEILVRKDVNEYIINENNFDTLCNVIFEISCVNKNDLFNNDDEVWQENTGSEREKKLIEYFKNKKKKKQEKETLQLCDYINLVSVLGKYSYDLVLDMTYYQLMSSFRSLVTLKNYQEELGYRWSYKYNIEEKQKNWIKEVKLENSTATL